MNYRLATILAREQHTADTTKVIDIDLQDPISQLSVTYEPDNNGSGANATAHPAKCIEKIELVDGSDVLFSLSGQEAQAVDFYDRNKVNPSIMCYLSGMYSEMVFNMNFGRHLWDEMYAFDPRKFTNPQLKITLNIDGGGDEANDGYLTVLAHTFDQRGISPVGFLMNKELKAFTLANSSHEYTDLPTDYPYRQIFLRAQRYGTGPEYQIDIVKLTEDSDKKIPLQHTMSQILRNVVQQWDPYEEWILVASNTTTGEYYYCTPAYWPGFSNSQWRAAAVAVGTSQYEGDGGRFKHSASTVNLNVDVHCRGWAPHAVVPLLPKFGEDAALWYDVSNLGSLKLDVLGGSGVGTAQTAEIITQQLRKY
jgi:hypothetical protein